MSDTMGSVIDKLITVDMKMWHNQEFLYEVRRVSFEEFKNKFLSTEDEQLALFESIKKCCDLNFQRNELIDEIDEKLYGMFKKINEGTEINDNELMQKKHKTY